jgi:hypothetical protein
MNNIILNNYIIIFLFIFIFFKYFYQEKTSDQYEDI